MICFSPEREEGIPIQPKTKRPELVKTEIRNVIGFQAER